MAESKPLEQTAQNEKLLSAVEDQLRRHDLRVIPGKTIEDVVSQMQSEGLTLGVEHGTLTGTVRGGDTANVPKSFENFAERNKSLFYPRSADLDGVTCKAQLDRTGKIEFLKKFGLSRYENLPQQPPVAPVELSPRSLDAKTYRSLSTEDKINFLRTYGESGVRKVLLK